MERREPRRGLLWSSCLSDSSDLCAKIEIVNYIQARSYSPFSLRFSLVLRGKVHQFRGGGIRVVYVPQINLAERALRGETQLNLLFGRNLSLKSFFRDLKGRYWKAVLWFPLCALYGVCVKIVVNVKIEEFINNTNTTYTPFGRK